MKTNLVLIEGLCGTGKSTLAERLSKLLSGNGIPALFFDEGAKNHPVSLNGYAYLSREEYAALGRGYPDIQETAIVEECYALIPYSGSPAVECRRELYGYLSARELCWTDKPVAPQEHFTHAITCHWRRFVRSACDTDSVYVMEGVFLQHPIHDMLRLYNASDADIARHLAGVAEQLVDLHPILLYLSQPDVRAQQRRIAEIRNKDHYAQESSIRLMENRKCIELSLLKAMPFPAHIIENKDLNWDGVFCRMVQAVGH